MKTTVRAMRWIGVALALGAMASCGGGGGGSAPPAGVMAQTCSPNNPFRGDATAATTPGSLSTEKTWLRDYMDRAYLWYNEVPNVNAGATAYSDETDVFGSLDNYFNDLLTPARTASNKLKDQFSFIYPTAAWDALINSGSTAGFGVEWHIVQANTSTVPPTPREIRVAYVHTSSQAETRGIRRGDTLVQADGVSAQDGTPAGIAVLNAALAPANGTLHTLSFSRAGVAGTTDYTMTAGIVTLTPVRSSVLNVSGQKVGYILFNDHVLTAEQPLINAFDALRTAGLTDLVLDLRYNGGGYLYIASEVAYMIAGTTGTFESTVFNNKRQADNSTTPFIDTACVPDPATFQCTSNNALPTLGLSRVYVLTSSSTCSASEAIVNGLRGANIDVRLIGTTTCGKPYGFFGQDNCGITYFPIEFQGVNAKGFGDYADGFIPGGIGAAGNNVPGCAARDDLDHALGDPAEGQLAAALFHRSSNNASCLPFMASPRESPLAAAARRPATMGGVIKPAVLTNRNARMPLR